MDLITRACTPRPDVLAGRIPDNHFAAQLDNIVRQPKNYPVYGDPEQFFAVTYPTSGLKKMLAMVFSRLGGKGESGIIRPETSFGGGKTHGLIAAYHLAKGAHPSNLAEFIDPDVLPIGTVQVAAVVGDSLDPVRGITTNGHPSTTIWGEIAAQVSDHAFSVMKANDRERTVPSTLTIKESLNGVPTVIIIDEIAQYLRILSASASPAAKDLVRGLPVYLKNLIEVASDPSQRLVVIITMASTVNAFAAETEQMRAVLTEAGMQADVELAASELEEVLVRQIQPQSVILPANNEEIGEILKRRLFESVDPRAAKAARDAYVSLYETLSAAEERLDGGADKPQLYGEAIERFYPFHPELIRVLDKRIGNIALFQRARGALKLLAELVAELYRSQSQSEIINVGDVDLSCEPIRNHLTISLGREPLQRVAEVDIAGANAHIASVDQEYPSPYAKRIATTIFLHSLEWTENRGARRSDWLLGSIRPTERTEVLEGALKSASSVCWYLSSHGNTWFFSEEPNPNAIIAEFADTILESQTTDRLLELLTTRSPSESLASTVQFSHGTHIADAPQLRLVVMDPRSYLVPSRTPESFMEELRSIQDYCGDSRRPRTYKNTLAFVAANQEQYAGLRTLVKRDMALEAMSTRPEFWNGLPAQIRDTLTKIRDKTKGELNIGVNMCFKHLYYPSEGGLAHVALDPITQGNPKNLTMVIIDYLKEIQKIHQTEFAWDWLRQNAWYPRSASSISTKSLAEHFWTDPARPIIADAGLIRSAIKSGVTSGKLVLQELASGAVYHKDHLMGLSVTIGSDVELIEYHSAQDQGLLRRPITTALVRNALDAGCEIAADIRTYFEHELNAEPTKGEVQDALAKFVSEDSYRSYVIVDIEAGGDAAITPSDIRKVGFDRLVVKKTSEVDLGDPTTPRESPRKRKHTVNGNATRCFSELRDFVNDATHYSDGISVLTISLTPSSVDDLNQVDLLRTLPSMLPGSGIIKTLAFDLRWEASERGRELGVKGENQLIGDATTILTSFIRIAKGGGQVGGTGITLSLQFESPLTVDALVFTQIEDKIKGIGFTAELSMEVTLP